MSIDLQRHPKASDGREVVTTNMFPRNSFVCFAGDGDDIENGGMFGGTEFYVMHDGDPDADMSVTWQFKDWISLAGAHAEYKNGAIGDHLSFRVYTPASTVTENTGAGAYAKLNVATGVNMFVPPGTPGAGDNDWDLNLTETLNSNVGILKVNPIPAMNGDGMFTFTCCDNSMIYTPGAGNCNLFDAEITLANYVHKHWLLLTSGSVPFLIPNSEPKKLAPNYKYEATVHHAGGDNTIEIAWVMTLARECTV